MGSELQWPGALGLWPLWSRGLPGPAEPCLSSCLWALCSSGWCSQRLLCGLGMVCCFVSAHWTLSCSSRGLATPAGLCASAAHPADEDFQSICEDHMGRRMSCNGAWQQLVASLSTLLSLFFTRLLLPRSRPSLLASTVTLAFKYCLLGC